MKPHKHAEVIKAWADGAQIQVANAGKGDWEDAKSPVWSDQFEYRVKPERDYPATRMSYEDMETAYLRNGGASSWHSTAAKSLANAALRHAIDAGQVIVAPKDDPAFDGSLCDDPAEVAFWNFDARKKGYAECKGGPQSERDAFKAEYRKAVADRAARDMAMAVAVRGACHRAVMCASGPATTAIANLDLAAIIATVQP